MSLDGSVLERHVHGKVPPADRESRRIPRYQGTGDAEIGPVAHEFVGVEQTKGQSDHGGDGCQGDVALRKVEFETDDFRALPAAPANDAGVGNGGGVRAGARAGEGEAGHLVAACQPRQVVILLSFRSIVQQQFRRPQGIRHRDGRGCRARARGNLDEHTGMRIRREFQAAITPRNDHPEKAPRLDEGPHLGGQVRAAVRNVPVIQHGAQFLAGPVEKGLFLRGEHRHLGGHEFLPVGTAGKQLSVPPHRPRVQRLALRRGHGRQQSSVTAQERTRHGAQPQWP